MFWEQANPSGTCGKSIGNIWQTVERAKIAATVQASIFAFTLPDVVEQQINLESK